ncbi:MAG: MgtC/SapB family protein [Lachnospiraceae bacterium]|nr:MgtC/SapB family protein [Lachnospiraceae bacterium]
MGNIISTNDLIYLFRIFLAMCAGAVIGYERQQRVKVAGLRTHILISMASALMMIISKHAFDDVLLAADVPGLGLDVSRVAAGIIAGMGIFSGGIVFIGKRGNVQGLTTAAGIWATIGIGMVIGAGMYVLGIGSVIFVELVQFILHHDLSIYRHAVSASVTFTLKDPDEDYTKLKERLKEYGAKMYSIKWKKAANGTSQIGATVVFRAGYERDEIVKILNGFDEVTGFEM